MRLLDFVRALAAFTVAWAAFAQMPARQHRLDAPHTSATRPRYHWVAAMPAAPPSAMDLPKQ